MGTVIRKVGRFMRFGLVALVVIGILIVSWFALWGERTLRSQVEQALARSLNRPVIVGALSVNLARREVELKDVIIPGRPESKRPTLKAPKMRLGLSFRSLFTPNVLLRRFELERPELSLQVFADGSTDFPALQGGATSGKTVSLGDLVIRSGYLYVNDRRSPLDLSWPNFEAKLNSGFRNLLKGTMSSGPGPLRIGDLEAVGTRMSVDLRFEDSVLHIEGGTFDASDSKLSLKGAIDLEKEPTGDIRFTGPLNLATLDRSIVGTGLDLQGIADTDLVLKVAGGSLALSGMLAGRQGSFDSIPVETFETKVVWDGSNVTLDPLRLDALDGRAVLNVAVPEGKDTQVKGTLEGVNAQPLMAWLFGASATGLGARVSGPLDLALPRGAATLFSGTGDFTLTAEPAFGDPLSGRVPFKAVKGAVNLNGATFVVSRTSVKVDGRIGTDRRLAVALDLSSEDLISTDHMGARLRRAFGTPQATPLGLSGKGVLSGDISGTLADPLVTGTFQGTDIAYLGVKWGDVNWSGAASPVELRSEKLAASRDGATIELHGRQRLGDTGVDDAMDLEIAVKGWPATDLLKVVGSEMDVDTSVAGTLHLSGTRARPQGSGSLTSAAGKAMGLPFTNAGLRLRFEGEPLRIESLNATLGGGDVEAHGVLTTADDTPAFEGDVAFSNVELADLGLQKADAPAIGGRITGTATLSGPIDRPTLKAHLESKRIFYGDEGIGAVTMAIEGRGDGTLALTASADSTRFKAAITGSVEARAPHQGRLSVRLANARIDPVLRALGSRFENAVVITASANAEIEGPFEAPDRVTARIRDGRLKVAVPDYFVEASPGSIIDVENREVRIAGLTLTGEGTSLAISGKVALRPGDENDLSVAGRADLRVFSGFLREWRLRGATTLRAQVRGTPKAPRASGGIDIQGGALRVRAFPQGLDDLNGRIVFNETQARVAGLEGRFGGGRVSVSGQVNFGGTVPSSFDFLIDGDALGLRYPEGLRATFGADLRLQGTTDAHWLTGELLVSKALWTRKYAITSELFASQAATTVFPGAAGYRPSPMRLDINIKAPGTLRLDNNIANIAARADLSLTGSPNEPQLLGRVEIERGKVYFSGNTYEVRKGVAHFSNPREINPVFDLEADTRLRNYRLTLQANGTLDRVTTRITSDPPLTTAQIASLLTGGDENEVAAGSNSSIADLKTLGTGGVNTFASTWLDENITGRVAQGFGLSRLSIDPGPGLLRTSGSRLTVGKRVTPDLEVVYTRSLFNSSGVERQLVSAEYSLSNRFSLVTSWEEQLGFATDVRARFVLKK